MALVLSNGWIAWAVRGLLILAGYVYFTSQDVRADRANLDADAQLATAV